MGGLDGGDSLLALNKTLGQQRVVFGLLLFLADESSLVQRAEVTAALQSDGCNETLNLGCLGIRLRAFLLLRGDFTANNVLPDIVLLIEVEELADFGGALGAKAFGEDVVRKTNNGGVASFDDNQAEYGDVGADDATADRLALALSRSARTEARVTLREQKTDTVRQKDTLLHGETLLVIAARDAENISSPFVAERVSSNLLRDLLVIEDANAPLVVDIDCLLLPRRRVSDVKLHLKMKR